MNQRTYGNVKRRNMKKIKQLVGKAVDSKKFIVIVIAASIVLFLYFYADFLFTMFIRIFAPMNGI